MNKKVENSFFLTLGFIILFAVTCASYYCLSPAEQVIFINNLMQE